jgi:hypothetical protein
VRVKYVQQKIMWSDTSEIGIRATKNYVAIVN